MSLTSVSNRDLKNIYRFGMFVLAIGMGVTTLGARMFYLQVVQGQA